MNSEPLRDDFQVILAACQDRRPISDKAMQRLSQRLLVAEPDELFANNLGEKGERVLLAGWAATRLATLARERPDLVLVETAASVVAALGDSADDAAAIASLLEKFPSVLSRLAHCSRERINGLGEPLARTESQLSTASQRVALAFEWARRFTVAPDQADEIIAGFEQEASRGYWRPNLIAMLAEAVSAVPAAHAARHVARSDAAPAVEKQKLFRISQAHDLRGPIQLKLDKLKKRQRIASRHVAGGPSANRGGRSSRGQSRSR